MASRKHETRPKAAARPKRRSPAQGRSPAATLRAGLEARLDTLRTELTRKDELSKGRVHRLRVATRRLLAALELTGVATPPGTTKCVPEVEKLLKGLSKLRDIDVLLDGASPLAEQHMALRAALGGLGEQRERLARRAHRKIARFAADQLTTDVSATLSALDEHERRGSVRVMHAAVVGTMAMRYLDIERCRQAISADDRKSLHRLRVALKSYRYATELVEPILDARGKQEIEALKALQDQLGALRDLETLAALVRSRGKARNATPELVALGEALRAEQQRLATTCAAELEAGAAHWIF